MTFDAITVGGGLAGSTLATALTHAGHRVLVLEREIQFKDRVRGENMVAWGVAAARRLGLVDDLIAAGGHQPRSWITYMFGNPMMNRDLHDTTPHREVSLNIYHPSMQEALLERASRSGAEVKRGAKVVSVDAGPDRIPTVTFEHEGSRETVSARVVVGADGRASQVRGWGGFETRRNPDLLIIAGTLIQGTDVPDDAVHLAFGPGCATLLAPLGGRRARTYYVYPGAAGRLGLSGKDRVPEFIQLCKATGVPESWFAGAESIGPLAEFQGADNWVESPAKNGIALIGDAAASSDPSWGCGLSLTLLDVEHLANALCASHDWSTALDRYAKEHDQYYSALSRILGWMTELTWTPGPEADERRSRVFPRMMADPRGFPDSIGLGPFGPNDDQARKLVLGLD
ncbi:MAG TPA: NAD(P)/FAD-dependent oxidoreductase [Terriglobales bacterium]|nr:NAD(P)/FAD-dependent oxidoreductase [Terriglobales bacterium]